jgi:hypothetical protein
VNLLMAPFFQMLLDTVGWRRANLLGAGVVALVAVPVGVLIYHTPEEVGCLPDGDHRAAKPGTVAYAAVATAEECGNGKPAAGGGGWAAAGAGAAAPSVGTDHSYTRAQAFRTLPVYIFGLDIFFAAAIGAGTAQVMRPALRENGATLVSLPYHIMVPNGICQAVLPFVSGWARDKGLKPAYILAMSSFLVASAPFVLTMVGGEHQIALAICFGCNFGSVRVGLGRIVALYYQSSTSYHIH